MSAAKDSPKLQKAVDRHQLHRALVELKQVQSYCQQQQGQQQQQKENEVFYAVGILSPSDPSDDDYSHKSSTRTSFGSIILQEGKSNIHGPGEPSSRLIGDFWFSKGVNVSDRLMSARRANMSQQNIRHETDDLLLVQIYVPEAPRQEVNLFVKFALAAASKEYLDFKATLGRTSLELSDLVGDILAAYTATNAPWQDRTGLARIEDTYIKQSVMPIIDAVFSSLGLKSLKLKPFKLEVILTNGEHWFVEGWMSRTEQHWQRGQLPVPNGYEKVLQSDFFAKAGQLCFAIMEVKKPKTTKEDAEDDTRRDSSRVSREQYASEQVQGSVKRIIQRLRGLHHEPGARGHLRPKEPWTVQVTTRPTRRYRAAAGPGPLDRSQKHRIKHGQTD
ncbi:hypothetical protein BC939DRAFT_479478 [Gamsiella multidivaricata]|uniref:uncharacterized protein n=1 Tax=Gamsiella multidivaricata TaxID=101098 RepID=UPI002220167B|nr:uncharacterized protein BC939DRAFT_479478 [Gamsiella multidivaricata]KAI7819624.1 hypothetical protein BC939DRAFT_479478 [Gamsiella multidivaricata]